MGRKVECEIRATEVEFNGRMINGVEATCTRCGHTETAGGESDASVRRCFVLLRENCPEDEENFYIRDDE